MTQIQLRPSFFRATRAKQELLQTVKEHIVAMASRLLTETKSIYSNIEREYLAVIYGLEKFECYLLCRGVTVETDHSPLQQIFEKNING